MDFVDMGPAMAQSHNERAAKEAKTAADEAKAEIAALKSRVAELEKAVDHIKFFLVL